MNSDQQSALIRASLIFIGLIAAGSAFVFIVVYYPALIFVALCIAWFGGLFYLIYSYQMHKIKQAKYFAELDAKHAANDPDKRPRARYMVTPK
jgi:hypothetical protein